MHSELWVVYFESANYAGYGEYCVVWASDEIDAGDKASEYAEEFYREQDSDQLEEEGHDLDGMTYAAIIKVYPLASDKASDIRKYMNDPKQKHFFPIVN